MRCSIWSRVAGGCVLAGWLAMAVGSSDAAEEAQRFLEGLRQAGYYDTAMDYLDSVRNDPAVDKEFKDAVDYEAGITLIAAAQRGRQSSIKEQHLAEARKRFEKFLTEHPKHPLAAGVKTQLAELLAERGQIKVGQSALPKRTKAEKKQLLEEGRALFREAEKILEGLEKKFVAEYKKFPKLIEKTDTKRAKEKQQLEQHILKARLALPTVLYQISKTYEAGSDDHKKMLLATADKYAKFYEMYSPNYLHSFYARMWEGRCYKELAPTDKTYWKKAFSCYEDVLELEDDRPLFREVKSKALTLALETAKEQKNPKTLEKTVALFCEWDKKARPNEESSPVGLALKFHGADAILQHARTLKKDRTKEKTTLLKTAKTAFTLVTRYPNAYQKQARAKLRGPELATGAVETDPTSFTDACDRAEESLHLTQDTGLSEEELAAARSEAIRFFRLALKMRPEEVDIEKINSIRYYLTYLYISSGDLYESAVMGGFLAKQYSGGPVAKQSAKLALTAWQMLYNDARTRQEAAKGDQEASERIKAEIEFFNAQMIDVAKHTAATWPGEKEADDAWGLLIRMALIANNLDTAREYLGKIAADSPNRGKMQLMVGQKIWADYLRKSKLDENAPNRPDQAALDKLVADAQATLEEGILAMRKPVDDGDEEISYTLAASVLSLAQINLGAGQPEKAVKWLEDDKIGALTLVNAKHASTDRGSFRVQTCKAALRAYVAVQKLDEAGKAMKTLENLIGESGDAQAGRTLTRTYISLGRELQDQLERLRKENKTAEMEKVAGGFELFLGNILKRGEKGNTFSSLNWVAGTYRGMANEFDRPGSKTPEKAKNYYAKAVTAYDTILKLIKDKKIEAPKGAVDAINIRKAKCLRRLGRYMDALKIIKAILRERNVVLDAQLEGCYAYQDWGREDSRAYRKAILGSYDKKKGKPTVCVVWGWGKLAKRVIRSKPHQVLFHEARYNLALCRFQWALNPPKNEKGRKRELLEMAERDVLIIQKLFPDMGGPQWRHKYDELLKDIQETQGKKRTGLKKK